MNGTPTEKRLTLNELLRRFRANLHVAARRAELAREIVALVDANPWLNDQLPLDLGGIVRRDAGVRR